MLAGDPSQSSLLRMTTTYDTYVRSVRVLVLATLAATGVLAAPLRAPVPLGHPLQDKNFYVLSLLEAMPPIASDLAEHKRDAMRNALEHCGNDVACFADAFRWSETDIAAASDALRRVPLPPTVDFLLRRSGMYVRYDRKSDADLLVAAWVDAAHAINNIIDVYGTGKPPRYSAIDSISFDVKGPQFAQLIRTTVAVLNDQRSEMHVFFEPSLRFALHLLEINGRDEAARHEPLEAFVNAGVLRSIASIKWNDFPYTVIVVPGYGPDQPQWHLSPQGRLRVELAARRYHERKAPLILVTGGYVHPSQTPYCEAIEMKSALARLHVPEDSIIIEPQARHTTTNLRNAARLMYRYGIPFDRKALVTTDEFQSTDIGSEGFAQRCARELGYLPATILRRLSPFDLEFTPSLDSLQIDAMDPLDP